MEDAGLWAEDLKRPGIEEALGILERADAQALVAAKRERLSPALLDLVALLASAQKQGWALVALDCALETTTPAGEALAHLLATFAQFERRLISQRTREALAIKRAQGVRLGWPADDVPVRDRADQARASSRREPGRDPNGEGAENSNRLCSPKSGELSVS